MGFSAVLCFTAVLLYTHEKSTTLTHYLLSGLKFAHKKSGEVVTVVWVVTLGGKIKDNA